MTIPQVCDAIGVSTELGYAIAAKGDLPVVRFGRRMIVPKTALLAMLAMTESPAAAPTS